MPRKIIVTVAEIYERRGRAWTCHYERRGRAAAMVTAGFVPFALVAAVSQELPPPRLDVDGALFDFGIDARRRAGALAARWPRVPADLFCAWYWSAGDWQKFVRAFQDLPDVTEDHYWTHDIRKESAWLAPVSSARRGRRAVEKPVDNKSTSRAIKVQVGRFSTVARDG